MSFLFILICIPLLIALLNSGFINWLKKSMARLFNKRQAHIFDHQYLESKAFYMYRFREVPCVTYVDDIDINSAYAYVDSHYKNKIVDIYQNCFYNHKDTAHQFYKTVFVLSNKIMIEVAGQYARILYPNNSYNFADNLVKAFSAYKLPQKGEDFEINIISFSNGCLDLKPLPLKPTVLDLNLYYNDDFLKVDEFIRERLNQQNDKGILLLHGIPGTGKTTYLRHLVGSLKKKVLFLSPSVAGNLTSPEFIDLLIDNPNTVLVIEDAENIMVDRKINRDSSVSNLLNLSDGLLSDCLNVQIICTFNSALNTIDSALLRKGRLITRYEFGKLGIEKSQKLSDHFGFDTKIYAPMTIAEIANQHIISQTTSLIPEIGFKREGVLS